MGFRPPRNGKSYALSVSGCLGDFYNSVFNIKIRLFPLAQKEVTSAVPDSVPQAILVFSAGVLYPWSRPSLGLRAISINGVCVELLWTANKPRSEVNDCQPEHGERRRAGDLGVGGTATSLLSSWAAVHPGESQVVITM